MPHAALIEFVGIFAVLRPLGDAVALELEQLRLDRAGDRGDDLVLQLEEVGEVAVVFFSEQVVAGVGPNQLRGDADPAPGFAHTAL